jgi:hypothetical protein
MNVWLLTYEDIEEDSLISAKEDFLKFFSEGKHQISGNGFYLRRFLGADEKSHPIYTSLLLIYHYTLGDDIRACYVTFKEGIKEEFYDCYTFVDNVFKKKSK